MLSLIRLANAPAVSRIVRYHPTGLVVGVVDVSVCREDGSVLCFTQIEVEAVFDVSRKPIGVIEGSAKDSNACRKGFEGHVQLRSAVFAKVDLYGLSTSVGNMIVGSRLVTCDGWAFFREHGFNEIGRTGGALAKRATTVDNVIRLTVY